MSEFIQISGAVDGYIINRAGIVRNPAGRELKPFGAGYVKIKVLNGQMRSVSIKQLVLRNFSDESKDEIVSATAEVVCGVDNTPQLVEAHEVIDDVVVDDLLSKFSLEELELEINKRKKALFLAYRKDLSRALIGFYKNGGDFNQVAELTKEVVAQEYGYDLS